MRSPWNEARKEEKITTQARGGKDTIIFIIATRAQRSEGAQKEVVAAVRGRSHEAV
jgi:hypothetical protein